LFKVDKPNFRLQFMMRKSDSEAYGRNGAEGAKGGDGSDREIALGKCRTKENYAERREEIIDNTDLDTFLIHL